MAIFSVFLSILDHSALRANERTSEWPSTLCVYSFVIVLTLGRVHVAFGRVGKTTHRVRGRRGKGTVSPGFPAFKAEIDDTVYLCDLYNPWLSAYKF